MVRIDYQRRNAADQNKNRRSWGAAATKNHPPAMEVQTMNTRALQKVKSFVSSNAFAAACAGYALGSVAASMVGRLI